MSTQVQGNILSLQIHRNKRQPMEKSTSLNLIKNFGIEGDIYGTNKSSRENNQILLMDKETLEKSRLMKRRQGFFHYEDLGKITVPDKDAVGFISERERFQTDFAAHEKQRREYLYTRKEANIVKLQEEMSKKEESRWKGR